ncbi:MAG TPA: LuxR C-terminal-related transcriptional regulator [Amycolatopsis sp.]|uniref:LuxR C-terminal-related transcriptional regulator n=1 Tax=Amycolatopsis sp. TaxID=37632 RepID=UPI002B497A11|nr:LuxR C-terminal-related transcriptional regulator [Amycolatopsis sp.]HKS48338.1 LuxR C-terminal-related transcriptional regulator [Amycolatopsis sp.]
MLRGRYSELATLDQLLAHVKDGRGGALEIDGDAGMGKTAMLAAAKSAASDFLVLDAEGVSAERTIPFAGLHQLLRPVLDEHDLTGVASEENAFAVYSAVTGLLAKVARDQPVLCCADDFPLLDEVSRAALVFAARRLGGDPVILLFAGCPERPTRLPRLVLDPVSDVAGQQILHDHVPDGLSPELCEELVSLASGNPQALVELVSALSLEQLAGTKPPPVSLPANSSLRTRHRERLEALSPDARKLVLLAVADEALDLDTVVRAAAHAGIDLHALDEAASSGLLRVSGQRAEIPTRLISSSLYADAPLSDRRATHDLLAGVLDRAEQRLKALWHRAATAPKPNEPLADELDLAAGKARRSKDYESSSRAYQQAAELTADPDAKALRLITAARDFWLSGHTHRSRALLRTLRPMAGNDTVRSLADILEGEIELREGVPTVGHQILLDAADRLTGTNLALAITALMRAGEASIAAGNFDGYIATARRVRALSGHDDPLVRLMRDHCAGLSAMVQGEYDRAKEPLHRVVTLAGQVHGCTPKFWGCLAALVRGDDRRAHHLAAQAVNVARADGTGVHTPRALEFLAHTALRLDHYPSALTSAVEGLRLAQAAKHHNSTISHLCLLALIAALQGDKDTTQARLTTAADQARGRRLAWPSAVTRWALACLDLAEERPSDALTRLRPVITGLDGSSPFVRIMATPHFIEAAVRCGERKKATHALEVFDDWACSTRNPGQLALSQRCQALLASGTEADERFREAVRLHRRGDRPFELAKTELFYGERLRRNRKPRAAREHLRNAWKTFQRYDAAYWSDRARAELRAAGESVEPEGRASIGDLTPQQAQISRLVTEGATNREIAAQLFLSPRTVDHHLRNIFAKLGIRSRVELSALFR